jgi:hypothetical protein
MYVDGVLITPISNRALARKLNITSNDGCASSYEFDKTYGVKIFTNPAPAGLEWIENDWNLPGEPFFAFVLTRIVPGFPTQGAF